MQLWFITRSLAAQGAMETALFFFTVPLDGETTPGGRRKRGTQEKRFAAGVVGRTTTSQMSR